MKYTSIAVDLAVSHGMLQTVASEGAELADLVEAVAWRAPAHWMDRFRRAVRPAGATRLRCPDDISEPLTERELDVVRFLPSRLTVRRDRPGALYFPKHAQVSPKSHLPKARRALPGRSECRSSTDNGGPLRW